MRKKDTKNFTTGSLSRSLPSDEEFAPTPRSRSREPNSRFQDIPEDSETSPFLAGSSLEEGRGRRPANRISGATNMYGTFRDASPHYLQLERPVATLQRNTSIFKISGMINDHAGMYEKYRKSDDELKDMKKKTKAFYEQQNEILDGFAEVDAILDNTTALAQSGELAPIVPVKIDTEEEDAFASKVALAIAVNFAINAILLAAKILVVILSHSMSMIASATDSAMDFLITAIIWSTSKFIGQKDWRSQYLYPTGKSRMEPMSIVVFSVFMISSFIQVFIESANRLLDEPHMTVIPFSGIMVMLGTIAIKLVMWIWCRSIDNTSVKALAQDSENDVVFNVFSIIFPLVGQHMNWPRLDPLGGLILSIYIIVEWVETLFENVIKLSNRRASPAEHQRAAYLITRFSPLIKGIQHLSVYYTGDKLLIETDIIIPQETPLTVAHNIGESAQYGLEQLEGVNRAFVHIDVTANKLSGHIDR